MLRVLSIVSIFVLGSVLGFWFGSKPQAAAKSVVSVCGLADTRAGQWLDQNQVDHVVLNLADALSLDPNDRAGLAQDARHEDSRCAQALAQLDSADRNAPPRS